MKCFECGQEFTQGFMMYHDTKFCTNKCILKYIEKHEYNPDKTLVSIIQRNTNFDNYQHQSKYEELEAIKNKHTQQQESPSGFLYNIIYNIFGEYD